MAMIYYIFLFISILFSQDFDIGSKSISPLLLNNNVLNQNIQNQSSQNALDGKIDPSLYIVGPGDKFYLSFSANNFSFNNYLTISPVGDIIIPSIGLVNLNNLLLNDAYLLIIDKCKSKYNNIDVSITLTDTRKFYVNVYGFSFLPSKILVSPLNRVTDAFSIILNKIDNSQINQISSRNIELHRDNIISRVDLMKYKIVGNTYNPKLIEGDEIHLSRFEEYIDIYGGVSQPGRYEYVENELLNDFVLIAGGYSKNVLKNNIEISRFDNSNTEFKLNINENDIKDILLKPYDHINVLIDKDYRNRNLVYISGEINTPGYYVISKNMSFQDLLIKAGGYTQNADSSRLFINNKLAIEEDLELKRIMLIAPQKRSMAEISYLKSRSIISKGIMSSDNKDMTDQFLNYTIHPNDEVNIPALFNFVEIIGGVKNPGRYPYIEGYRVIDYINEAGGFTKRAKNKLYLINSFNQRKSINRKFSKIYNGETIFVQTKEDFNLWNKFQESMGLMGQLATLIAVLQSASN